LKVKSIGSHCGGHVPPQAEVNAFVLMGEAPPMPKPSFLMTAQKAAATPMRTSAR
jgi:hypothetical protein